MNTSETGCGKQEVGGSGERDGEGEER